MSTQHSCARGRVGRTRVLEGKSRVSHRSQRSLPGWTNTVHLLLGGLEDSGSETIPPPETGQNPKDPRFCYNPPDILEVVRRP